MFPALRDEMEQVLATGSIEDGDDDGHHPPPLHVRGGARVPPEVAGEVADLIEELATGPGGKADDAPGRRVVEVRRAMQREYARRDVYFLEEATATVLGWALILLDATSSPDRAGDGTVLQIEALLFAIVRRHFHEEACYPHLLRILLEAKENVAVMRLMQEFGGEEGGGGAREARRALRMRRRYLHSYLPVAFCLAMSGTRKDAAYEEMERICCAEDGDERRAMIEGSSVVGRLVPERALELVLDVVP